VGKGLRVWSSRQLLQAGRYPLAFITTNIDEEEVTRSQSPQQQNLLLLKRGNRGIEGVLFRSEGMKGEKGSTKGVYYPSAMKIPLFAVHRSLQTSGNKKKSLLSGVVVCPKQRPEKTGGRGEGSLQGLTRELR